MSYSGGYGKRSSAVFRFIATNSNDMVMVSENVKTSDMASFLELARRENPRAPILPILDNTEIHESKLTKAEKLGIIRTFLPPYSR